MSDERGLAIGFATVAFALRAEPVPRLGAHAFQSTIAGGFRG